MNFSFNFLFFSIRLYPAIVNGFFAHWMVLGIRLKIFSGLRNSSKKGSMWGTGFEPAIAFATRPSIWRRNRLTTPTSLFLFPKKPLGKLNGVIKENQPIIKNILKILQFRFFRYFIFSEFWALI